MSGETSPGALNVAAKCLFRQIGTVGVDKVSDYSRINVSRPPRRAPGGDLSVQRFAGATGCGGVWAPVSRRS
jgi:hypothetical protein